MRKLPYDNKDISSIFEYSKGLVHHCLRDFASDADERKGKGGLAQLVEELYFGYDVNSSPEADFADAHVELKASPLKKSASDELLIKERLVCCLINYQKDWDKAFEESHFYKKCLTMLILFYLHSSDTSQLDLLFLFTILWRIPHKDLLIIKRDYDVIIGKIREGKAQTLSEGDTMYLGACRKGQKGERLVCQHGSDIGAPRRAWCLKTSYMRTVLEEVKNHHINGAYCNFQMQPSSMEPLFSLGELEQDSVEHIMEKRFAPYCGLSYGELCESLHVNPFSAKSKYFVLANHIAGKSKVGNVNRSEEFVKSGLTLKTIRIREDGTIRESMSFENIDYQEVYDCSEWTDSRLYELFTSRFLFVVFRETGQWMGLPDNRREREYRLEKVAFWTMPQDDLEVAREYWEDIRQNVCANHISSKYFWKQNDGRCFHVRPKGRDSSDLAFNPHGGKARKYCYWFNAKYVKQIIEHEI